MSWDTEKLDALLAEMIARVKSDSGDVGEVLGYWAYKLKACQSAAMAESLGGQNGR